jgi:hypothetical protein
MMTQTIVALATASYPIPSADDLGSPAARRLAGVGLLIARCDEHRWAFDLSAEGCACESAQKPLLEWALKAFPGEGRLVGWRLAEDVVPALLSAAKDAEPELARAFLQRLHGLLTALSDDLALDRGGAAAPPLHDHLRARGLITESIEPGPVEPPWANRRAAALLDQLRSDAVALMHLWLMTQPDAGDARVAMGRWLAERRAASELP